MVDTTTLSEVQSPAITHRLWTRDEYERMVEFGILDENDRVELIGGEIVNVTALLSGHMTAISLGQEVLAPLVGPDHHIRVQGPLALDPDSEPEPDLAVVAGRPRDYREAHPTTALLVIEVAETSLAFDRLRKASVYARAHIPEYWIINLLDKRLEVYRDPAPDGASPLGWAYQQRLSFGPEERISLSMIPGAEILVKDLLP